VSNSGIRIKDDGFVKSGLFRRHSIFAESNFLFVLVLVLVIGF